MTGTYADMLEDHRTNRRALLIASAADAIDAHGLRSVTIDAIAAHAGVSKVVLYRYFGSKDALIDAVLADMVEALLGVDAMPADKWTERLPYTLALARQKRAALRILLRQAPHDPRFGRYVEHLHTVLAERTIHRMQEALGEPGIMPGDPAMLARMVSSFLLDAYLNWLDGGNLAKEMEFLDWLAASVQAMTRQWWNGAQA
ncbi:TetR/AcrR family transcriptional regulator [Pseudomonas corrugata]|uniref:TetR/AcrR family transcriptional regulator n=2 Tax=Pseudomonas corrugata TaxID=47879 RepID=A0A7Y6DK45_9PSED|nr:TetR/AcrR family transcriptional regulator [Pseudomonas corrugata]NUT89819.1 TetR/AcrR family transcriptional regulator [Pseudomonas corrugata]